MSRISFRHVPAYVAAMLLALATAAPAIAATAAAPSAPGHITVSDGVPAGTPSEQTTATQEPRVDCAFVVSLGSFGPAARSAAFSFTAFTARGGGDDGRAVAVAPSSPTPARVTLAVPSDASTASADVPDAHFAFRLDTSTLSTPTDAAPFHLQVTVTVSGAPGAPTATKTAPFALACPAPVTDLAIAATDTVDPVSTGGTTNYSLTVRNVGTAVVPAGAATLTDTVPDTLGVTSASGQGFSCDVSGQQLRCTNTVALDPGSQHDVTMITLASAAAGTATNTVRLAVADDATPANNVAVQTTTVASPSPAPDRTAKPAATFTDACTGAVTVAMTNTGTAPATFIITAPDATTEQLSVPADTTVPVTKTFSVTAARPAVVVAASGMPSLTHTFDPTCTPSAAAPATADTTPGTTTTPDTEPATTEPAAPVAGPQTPVTTARTPTTHSAPLLASAARSGTALPRLGAPPTTAVRSASRGQLTAVPAPMLAPAVALAGRAPSAASLPAGMLSVSSAAPDVGQALAPPPLVAPPATAPDTAARSVRSNRAPVLVGHEASTRGPSTAPLGAAAAGALGLLLGAGLVLRRRARTTPKP